MNSQIKCYCISLVENAHERFHCQEEFDRVGLKVDFEIVERSSKGGAHGCFTSHVNVLKKGLESGSKYIMIMEDDVYFDYPGTNMLGYYSDFLESLDDKMKWCFCLGYFSNSRTRTVNKDAVALKKCYCSHAYIVPRQTAEELVKMEWRGTPFDIHWHEMIDIYYAPYPMIAFQKNHKSSISNGFGFFLINTIGFRTVAKISEFRTSLPF